MNRLVAPESIMAAVLVLWFLPVNSTSMCEWLPIEDTMGIVQEEMELYIREMALPMVPCMLKGPSTLLSEILYFWSP
jgi:hypothetical protein